MPAGGWVGLQVHGWVEGNLGGWGCAGRHCTRLPERLPAGVHPCIRAPCTCGQVSARPDPHPACICHPCGRLAPHAGRAGECGALARLAGGSPPRHVYLRHAGGCAPGAAAVSTRADKCRDVPWLASSLHCWPCSILCPLASLHCWPCSVLCPLASLCCCAGPGHIVWFAGCALHWVVQH